MSLNIMQFEVSCDHQGNAVGCFCVSARAYACVRVDKMSTPICVFWPCVQACLRVIE